MPALLERLPAPSTAAPGAVPGDAAEEKGDSPGASEAGAATPPRVCSACYLSEEDLNRTGLLGCPRCYETFAPVIAAAAEVLHGVRVPGEWAKPQPRHTVTNPWPTRRGVRRTAP